MLRTLRIRQLVIIDDLSVEFGAGLNLLTGETGAGKSILVDALALAAGERADRSMVRGGEAAAVVEALFQVAPDSAAWTLALERGLAEGDSGEVLVRREIAADGPHRVAVNGSPCTLGLLKELGDRLLEIHGQHEHQSLLEARRHLELVDRLGEHGALLAETEATCDAVGEQARRLEELRQRAGERQRRQAELQAILREIDAVAPVPGELEELERERRRLRNASAIAALLDEVVALSYEAESAAAAVAAIAARKARELAAFDPDLEDPAERMQSAALELQDTGALFRDYRDRATFDPARLEEVEARRAALERLRLRYGKDETEVLATRDRAEEELARLRHVDREIEEAAAALTAAERRYAERAATLSLARVQAASRISPEVERQLRDLALGNAHLEVALHPIEGPSVAGADGVPVPLSRRGAERAEFLLSANPGEPFRPLRKVASGGELSRIMLALHGVFDAAGEGRALVFDEVDAGIGGAVADAVGARLARLARRHQVLCVTHLPQVACHADHHFAVRKRVQGGRARAGISPLSAAERVEELARMLAGKTPTEASRRHAAELLRQRAGGVPAGRRGARRGAAPRGGGEV